jgi:hypothetical protein
VWVAEERTASLVATETNQAVELFQARDLAALGDTLVVADAGNDRIVLFDRDLRFLSAAGRQGAGPGEFEAPVAVRVAGADIVVAELGNARFSWITASGESVRAPLAEVPAQSFGVLENGDILAPSRTATDYLARIGRAGRTAFAPRTDTLSEEESKAAKLGFRDAFVAVTAGDTVHVFDDELGDLIKFAPDGRRLMRRRLPASLMDTLDATNASLVRSLAQQNMAGSMARVKNLTASPDGRLVLLVRSGRTAGFVIDPHTYSARRIVTPTAELDANPPLTASSALILDGRLYLLARGDLLAYRLRAEAVR